MLTLQIKKKWFDMILSGEKQEEYREIKPYYTSRFKNIGMMPDPLGIDEFDLIHKSEEYRKFDIKFRNGYSNKSPYFIAKVYLTTKCGKTEWGAEPDVKYYCLHIGEITETYKCEYLPKENVV